MCITFCGIVLTGISTKVGFENLFSYFSEYGENFFRYLQYRLSFYLASFEVNFLKLVSREISFFDGFRVVYEAFIYRLNILFGAYIERPILPNVNVYNFSLVFSRYQLGNEIGGSPGLLIAFFQVFPIGVAFVITLIFVYVVAGLLKNSFGDADFSYLTIFILIFALQGILNSPVHVSTIIGPELIKTLLFFLLLSVKFTENIRKRKVI